MLTTGHRGHGGRNWIGASWIQAFISVLSVLSVVKRLVSIFTTEDTKITKEFI